MNILERILEAKRAEVAAAKEMLGEAAVAARARAQSPPRD
ncbi:MAG: indole-3-glycerol-phosphate synthase TrpC, partial [Betaproteobacteria bacterium]